MFGLDRVVRLVELAPLGNLAGIVQRTLDPRLTISDPLGTGTAERDFEVRVADVVRETAECVTVQLESASSRRLKFRAGQYLNLTTRIDDVEVTRAYSISSGESDVLQITVKEVPNGAVSQHIGRSLEPGHTLQATGPHGSFVLPSDPTAPLAFVAVGSGITPVLSMIATALDCDEDLPIRLVYANRRSEEIIFAALLDDLAARHPSLEVVHVLSQPAAKWKGERGRLTGERAHALLVPHPDAHIYLCGPEDLIDATMRSMIGSGVEAGRLHRERFLPRIRVASDPDLTQVPVTWVQSGIDDVQRPGETLLDASNRVNADVPFICEAGECGECKIRILRGEIIHEPDTCLEAEEAADGLALACSSYAVTDVEVDA